MTLQRIVAWLLRFAANCKVKESIHRNLASTLSCAELNVAKFWIVKDTQSSPFQDDIHTIKQEKPLP